MTREDFHSVPLLLRELPYILGALTPVTTLGHEPGLFDELADLMRRRGMGIQRVVVLGADPGLDAYAVAMRMATFWKGHASWSVLGLLLHDDDLAAAQRGVYPLSALPDSVPPWLRQGLCRHRHRPLLRIHPAIRSRVRFRHLTWPCPLRLREKADLLWCRGIFSFFLPPLAWRFLNNLLDGVRPAGFIVTDVAENVQSPPIRLRQISPHVFVRTGRT